MSQNFTLIERICLIIGQDFDDVSAALDLVGPQTMIEIIAESEKYAKIKTKGIKIKKSGADIDYSRDRENIRDWLSRALGFGSTLTGSIVATAGSASDMTRLSSRNPRTYSDPFPPIITTSGE